MPHQQPGDQHEQPTGFTQLAGTLEDWEATGAASRVKASMWLIDTVTHYQVLFQMWSAAAINDDFYLAEERFLSTEVLATPGGRQWWNRNQELFSKGFRTRIESQIPVQDGGFFQSILEDLREDRGKTT